MLMCWTTPAVAPQFPCWQGALLAGGQCRAGRGKLISHSDPGPMSIIVPHENTPADPVNIVVGQSWEHRLCSLLAYWLSRPHPSLELEIGFQQTSDTTTALWANTVRQAVNNLALGLAAEIMFQSIS